MNNRIQSFLSRPRASALFVTSFLCFSAQAQWVTWEVSAGGNGHMYRAVPGFPGLNWDVADQIAQADGGYLATINSAAENDFVFNLVNTSAFFSSFNGSGPALGGFQLDGSPEPAGGWSWVTGEPWSYTNWLPTQPDNGLEREDRLHYFSNLSGTPASTWNDIYRADSNLGGYVVEVVPEPASVALVGLGMLLFGVKKSKKFFTPTTSDVVGGPL